MSCSQTIKLLILRHGIVQSWPLIKAQFISCREAYVVLMANEKNTNNSKEGETEYSECPLFPNGHRKTGEVCFSTCFFGELITLACSFF